MKFLLFILLSLLVAIFAVQNSSVVAINFFNKSVESSLALVVIVCYLLGIITGFFYVIPGIIKKNLTISELKEKLKSDKKENKNTPPLS